jgi:SAM-dependent methyltransferase
MFFPDKLAGYRAALRVLKPGGRLLFSVWDRIEENAVSHVVADAAAAQFPTDPPRFLNRTPFGHHDVAAIRNQLADAGFGDIKIDTIAKRSRASSARDAAIGLCHGTPLRNEIEARDTSRLGAVTDAAIAALAARFGSGPIDGKMQAHLIVATRP